MRDRSGSAVRATLKWRSRAAITILLTTAFSACGGDPVAMPDVEESQLDVALSDIERAGVDDEVDIVGGGVFGVVDESNWTVCSQDPPAGAEVDEAPRLVVQRECPGAEASAPSEEAEPTPGQSAPAEPRRQRGGSRQAAPAAETFVMPPLVGLNLQLGQDVLQRLGSYVLTQTDALGLGRFQVLDDGWQICAQQPAAGVETPIETLVELQVVKIDEICP